MNHLAAGRGSVNFNAPHLEPKRVRNSRRGEFLENKPLYAVGSFEGSVEAGM